MQDTAKTLEIYETAFYPALTRMRINNIEEDTVSPHNNETIRDSHRRHNVNIVGYTVTETQKEKIKDLIHYSPTIPNTTGATRINAPK